MARSYVSRGVMSLIGCAGSSFNIQTDDFCDSSSATDAATVSLIPFLGKQSLQPNYSTPRCCNHGSSTFLCVSGSEHLKSIPVDMVTEKVAFKYPKSPLQTYLSSFRNETNQTSATQKLDSKDRYKGMMLGNQRLRRDTGLLEYMAEKVAPNKGEYQYMEYQYMDGLSSLVEVSAEGEEKRSAAHGTRSVVASGTPSSDSTVKRTWANVISPHASTSKPKTNPAGVEEFGKSPTPSVSILTRPQYSLRERRKMHYVFSLQDPRAYRYSKGLPHLSHVTNEVLPHGLWPQDHPDKKVQDEFREDLIPDLLSNAWRSALATSINDMEAHKKFWKLQWEGHGIYGLLGQREYMELIIRLQNFFGPIVNRHLRQHTIPRSGGRRKYLDPTAFLTQMRVVDGVYATLHPYHKNVTCQGGQEFGCLDNEDMDFYFFGEVRIYLNGVDPYTTLIPEAIGKESPHDLDFAVNII